MTEKFPLYTFILAHYNQSQYIFTALDSILQQTYPAIEIIVMDDRSDIFDKEGVALYIEERKKSNIKSVQIIRNEENIGTVRSLNRALKSTSGEFVHIFAADDRLHDDGVAGNFVTEFEKLGAGAEMICAHAMIMDEQMHPPGEYFCSPRLHGSFNEMDADEQYKMIANLCYWAMGAICARTDLYRRLDYFSERYKYVEDWPFFLHITRSGVKVHTMDIKALDHRDGGISRSFTDPDTPLSNGYLQDILEARETEIFPYLSLFPSREQNVLVDNYYRDYQSLVDVGGARKKFRWYNFGKSNKKIMARRFIVDWLYKNNSFIKYSLQIIYLSALILFVTFGLNNTSDAGIIDICMTISGAVLFCATAFFIINIIGWLAYRVFRWSKASRV